MNAATIRNRIYEKRLVELYCEMKTKKPDNRPRFGFCQNLDAEPQKITEKVNGPSLDSVRIFPVAVIPLPGNSRATQKRVRDFVRSLYT